jgi:predicted nucleic acid-binding protein
VTLVVDASVIVAALVDSGSDGEWAAEVIAGQVLAAPHHMPIETADILRRASLARQLTWDTTSLAHADLLALRVELFPYAPLADRCWQLRENLTTYDAAYVALAEELDAPLATLDQRLATAPGPRCVFETPR